MELHVVGDIVKFGLFTQKALDVLDKILLGGFRESGKTSKVLEKLEFRSEAERTAFILLTSYDFPFMTPPLSLIFLKGRSVAFRDYDGEVCLRLDGGLVSKAAPSLLEETVLDVLRNYLEEHPGQKTVETELCRAYTEGKLLPAELVGERLDQIVSSAVELVLKEMNKLYLARKYDELDEPAVELAKQVKK